MRRVSGTLTDSFGKLLAEQSFTLSNKEKLQRTRRGKEEYSYLSVLPCNRIQKAENKLESYKHDQPL